jgi:hypothetical protein
MKVPVTTLKTLICVLAVAACVQMAAVAAPSHRSSGQVQSDALQRG